MRFDARAGIVLAVLGVLSADAGAQTVQIAPFAGYQFGGSFNSPLLGAQYSLESGLNYGGSVDISINKTWRVELMYSRQESKISVANVESNFGLDVERYMAGIMEERGKGPTHYYGVALFGVTRFVPELPGFDRDSHFTIGVGLGIKHFFSDNLGVRTEVRGFYTFTETDGGVFCDNGTCLFFFAGQGLWQGDVNGGVILAF